MGIGKKGGVSKRGKEAYLSTLSSLTTNLALTKLTKTSVTFRRYLLVGELTKIIICPNKVTNQPFTQRSVIDVVHIFFCLKIRHPSLCL